MYQFLSSYGKRLFGCILNAMSLNCAEINLILEELDLEGSFIQNVVQPSYDTIAFYTYKEGVSRTVLVCLAPGVCRMCETRRKVPKNDKPLRFMEFLRSRIKGSRIASAAQIDDNRLVLWELTHGDERFRLWIRLWSGAANIVVTDGADAILDVFYRRPKRGEITGGSWVMPDPPGSGKTWEVRAFPPGEALSFNENIDRWYAEHASSLSREALLEEARKRHEGRRGRLEAALARLERKRESFLDADRFRHQGDLLTANLWKLSPGMDSVELEDYEKDNAPIRIPLDPLLKPQENAARYYTKYKKALSGLSELEDDITSTKRTLATLAEELRRMEDEPNPLVIHKLLRKQNTPRQQLDKKYPGLVFRVNDWMILVGRTAAENDALLRRHVRGHDHWLHTRDWPGGYVFVKARPGKSVPLDILLDAATLALFYSKGRKAGNADVYHTQVKYLRRAKGAPKGTVLPSNEKNLSVSLDEERLKRLETCKDDE